ncbi:MAG: AAA family ATPase, partial [bacterium]|nr:AAA family ATPase [bacterium]
LTDGKGRTVDFKNTVLIMTSNLGSQYLAENAFLDMREARMQVLEAVRAHFRPEFLNRIDEIIVFNPLSVQEIKQIVDIQIRLLQRRLEEKHIGLTITDAAKEVLAAEGFDPVYGARPLKRVLQKRVMDTIAMKLLAGEFAEGDHVVVDAQNGELVFSKRVEVEVVG